MLQCETRTFSVLLCLFLSVCLHKCSGQLNITAHPGQNITLPCHCVSSSKPFIAVEWTRSDLTPPEYVFLFRGGRIDKAYQHPSFVDRVDLRDRQMKDGNLSLILRNVSSSDNGTYECRVKEKEERHLIRSFILSEPINVIRLTVTDSTPGGNKDDGGIKDGHDGHFGLAVGLPVGLLLCVLLLVGGVSFVMYRKYKRTTDHNSYQPPAEQECETGMQL